MAEFQSFTKEEGFAPVDVPSITPYINENLEALRQSEQQNIKDQYVVDKERATELGKSFEALAQLGQKTAEYVKERRDEYRAKETQKMEIEEFNKYIADPEGYVSGIFKSEVQDMQNLNSQTENMGAEAYLQTGNHEVGRQIRDLSGWREVRTAKIQLALANKFYESWLPKQLAEANITDQATRGAAISQARSTFMKTFGLLGFKDELLGEALYPGQMKLHAKIMKEGAELDAQNNNFQDVTEATSLFETDLNFTALQNSLATSIDEKGKVLGNKRGFDEAIKHLKKMFQAGTISAEQLEAIKNQPMPGMGGRTYGEMKPAAFENLDQELSAEERENAQNIRDQHAAEAQQMADDYMAKVRDDGLVPTKADIEAIQEQMRKHGGEEDPRLNQLLKNTASAKTVREADALFENMAAAGTLTTADVLAVPSQEVHQRWLKVAQKLEEAREAGVKDHHKALEELVQTTPGLSATVDGKRGFESVMITAKVKGEFDRRLAELIKSDNGRTPVSQLATQALAETRANFEQGRNNPASIYYFSSDTSNPANPPGFVNYRNGLAQLATPDKREAGRARLKTVTQGLKTEGMKFLEKPGSILTKDEFLQMDKDMLEKDFTMPGIISYVASQTGLTPSEVIKRAREALDLPPMPMPPSLELIDNTLSPEAKSLIYNFQSAQRTQRGLSQMRQFEPSMVKGGYGETIQKAAEQYDIPVGILAALLEQESAYRPDIISGKTKSSAGALGIAQFLPGTAAQMGVDPLDPQSAIPGAAKYLRHLMDTYGFDLKTAIYAYNAGPGTVQKYGVGATEENKNYYPGIIAKAVKYGYGATALNDPSIIRPSMQVN